MKRVARVAVRHKHLGERETEEHWTTIKRNIMQHHALAPVEPDAEAPLFPLDQTPLECERRAVGLEDLKRLDGRARRVRLKSVVILGLERVAELARARVPRGDGLGTKREVGNLDDLEVGQVDNRHKVERERVVVRVERVVLGAGDVSPALMHIC